MRLPLSKWIGLLALLTPLILAPAFGQETVVVTVQAGKLQSIIPSELRSDTEYQFSVKVLDDVGKPLQGARIELRKTGGNLAIEGQTSGVTDNQGSVTLRLKFSAGGTVALYIDSRRVTNLIVLYRAPPANMIGLVVVVLALLVGILGYALYTGPFKWARAEKP